MATRKRSTIKSRKEEIRARKPKTVGGLIKESQRLSRSFKESVAVGGAIVGPGKFGKGAAKIAQKIKAIRKTRRLERAEAARARATTKANKERVTRALAREKPPAIGPSPRFVPSQRGGRGPTLRDLLKSDKSAKAVRARKRIADKRNPKTLAKGKELEAKAKFKEAQALLRNQEKRLTREQSDRIFRGGLRKGSINIPKKTTGKRLTKEAVDDRRFIREQTKILRESKGTTSQARRAARAKARQRNTKALLAAGATVAAAKIKGRSDKKRKGPKFE